MATTPIGAIAAPKAAKDATGAVANATSTSDIQDRFLTLLVTQMRNQDPLNPLDNAQVTSQLAQLSTVGGLEKINATLSSVLSALSQQQSLAAVGLAGSRVAVSGDTIALSGGSGTVGYGLDGAAESATVTITNAAGATVRTIQRGASNAGLNTFEWDGRDDAGKLLPDGAYHFSVTATANGKPAPAAAISVATVRGVIPASDGFVLDLGAAGMAPFASVLQILPKTST